MATHNIVLDGVVYELDPATNLLEIKNLVAEAITAGVRYVDFDTASGHTMSVLVTHRTRVLFAWVPAPDPAAPLDMRDRDTADFDDPYVDFDTWQTA